MVTLGEQIKEVLREIRMREHVYPNLIARGTMTQADADKQLARLNAVLETLLDLKAEREPELSL